MAWLLTTAFRWALWFLLTNDGSSLNLAIGLVVALLLPRARRANRSLPALLRAMAQALVAIPKAYVEAVALLGAASKREDWIEQPSHSRHDPLLIFLEVLAITMTPFTIVLGLSQDGGPLRYRVHRLMPARPSASAGDVLP
jgi:multicomponent Na+:H+ antiporter subunit E